MKHFDDYTQEELLSLIVSSQEKIPPIRRAIMRLTFQNDGLVLQQDEARILGYISEYGSIEWQTGNKAICRKSANTLGFEAIGNCMAVIERLLHDGLIEPAQQGARSFLVMTQTGADMLELHEIEEDIESAWDDTMSLSVDDKPLGGLFAV